MRDQSDAEIERISTIGPTSCHPDRVACTGVGERKCISDPGRVSDARDVSACLVEGWRKDIEASGNRLDFDWVEVLVADPRAKASTLEDKYVFEHEYRKNVYALGVNKPCAHFADQPYLSGKRTPLLDPENKFEKVELPVFRRCAIGPATQLRNTIAVTYHCELHYSFNPRTISGIICTDAPPGDYIFGDVTSYTILFTRSRDHWTLRGGMETAHADMLLPKCPPSK